MMRRKTKTVGVISGAIVLAAVTLFIVLHTAWWRNRLRDDFVKRLSSQFRGTLQLGRIDAIGWNSVEISDLVVTLDADTVAILPTLRVGLRTRSLFSKKVAIKRVEADSLLLRVQRGDDGRLNVAVAFMNLDTTVALTTGGGGSRWTVDLANLVIRGGRAVIDLDQDASRPPLRITPFDLKGALALDGDRFRISVDELRGTLHQPGLTLSRCSGVLQRSAGVWTLEDFELATAANEIRAHGTWSEKDDSSRRFELTTSALEFSELAPLLGMKAIVGHPSVHANGEARQGALHFELEVIEGEARLALEGQLDPRGHTYSARGTMQGIVLERWIPATVPATLVNGTFQVEGADFGRSWLPANGHLALSHTTVDRFHVDSLNVDGSMQPDDLSASVRLVAEFGEVWGTIALQDPTGSQTFVTDASFRRVEPQKLAPRFPSESRLNGRLQAHGSGLTASKLEAMGTIDLVDSKLARVAIDSVQGDLRVARQELQIDSLWVASPAGKVRLSGHYAISGAFAARGSAALDSVAALPLDFAGQPIGGTGHLDLAVSGSPDSIRGQASFQIANALYGKIAADALDGSITVAGAPKIPTARIEVQADSLRIGKFAVANAVGRGDYDHDRMTGALSWHGDSIPSGSVDFDASLRPTMTVALPRIELVLGGRTWTGQSGPIAIDPSRKKYAVHELNLQVDGGQVRVSGAASGDSLTQAEIRVSNLDLQALAAVFDSTLAVSGRVDGELRGSGSLENPSVSGQFQLQDAVYGGSRMDLVRVEGTYADSHLASMVTLSDSTGSDLLLTLNLPLAAPASGTQRIVDPNGVVEISIAAKRHDLSWLSGLAGARIRGVLSSDLSLTGTTDQPQLTGTFSLTEGAVKSAVSGLDVESILLDASGHGRQLRLDSLSMGSGSRQLRGHGVVVLGKATLKGGVDSLRLAIDARKFQVLARKKLDLAVDSHLDLEMHAKQVTVNGNVDLVRSKIYLPAIIGAVPTTKQVDLPLLVVATAPPDTVLVDTTAAVKRQSQLFQDARGKVRITIPEGTWLTGHALNIEIAGTVDVVKTGPDAEAFGVVEVKRGTCTVLGKTFRMEIGEVEFKGGKIDPLLRLTLLYDIRTPNRDKKELQLNVGGVASRPEIRFTIDEMEISQADALSYIVFGQSQDELTVSQQSSLGGENNRMGANLAADVLAAQMSSALARGVGMDVVELKGDENWSKASLTAGKYVSSDLYLSYEKGFGDYDTDETAPKIFTAEYELIRSLFLQLVSGNEATSGVDLILIIKR